MLLAWFHTFSSAQIGSMLLLVGLSVSTIIPLLVRRALKIEFDEHFAKGAEEAFKLFISLSLLLLAFCMVRAQGDYRGAEDIVGREGTVMLKLDRAYQSFGTADTDELRQVLRSYADHLVKDEWAQLATGQRATSATEDLRAMSLVSKQLEPETPEQQVARSEIIQSVNQLNDLREARISASLAKLPAVFWYAISTALSFLMVFGWLQSPLSKMVTYVGGVTCGVCLMLTVLISTSGIFSGEHAVSSEPIRNALAQMGKLEAGS
jgi:hypothetical protein